MPSLRRLALVLACAATLTACAGSDKLSARQPPGFVANAAEIVAATDWSDPETITVSVVGHAFSPAELTFHRDRATRLVVVNATDSDHGIAADQFFADIAVERVSGPAGTARAPWIEKLVVPAGQTKELWFVPARFGAYSFECPATGHPSLGERGIINVVR